MYSKLRMIMGSGSIAGYFLQALPIVCIAGIIYFAIRLFRLKKSGTVGIAIGAADSHYVMKAKSL